MNQKISPNKKNEVNLYNKIFLLSRNKLFYTEIGLEDSFQNRINLIFIHISFIFSKVNSFTPNKEFKKFYQNLFDILFKQIEFNMREIGYGDVLVNKNMKFLVKSFYNILLYCENFVDKTPESKINFLYKWLKINNGQKTSNNAFLVDYFNDFQSFCFDLSAENVLKGDLNYNYN